MQLKPMTRLPNEQAELIEEALSEIYECKEEKITALQELESILDKKVQPHILEQLKERNFVSIENNTVHLSKEAEQIASHVIRRKRLAERLLKDVLNLSEEFIDPAVCQWEHILSKEVTNSICTLLGHPSQSPRELSIPPGECCRIAKKEIAPVICSLNMLGRGDRGKITYLLLKKNPDLNRLLNQGLVPGTNVEVLQRFPTFVVQAGESQLAFDETIAEEIFVHPLQ